MSTAAVVLLSATAGAVGGWCFRVALEREHERQSKRQRIRDRLEGTAGYDVPDTDEMSEPRTWGIG